MKWILFYVSCFNCKHYVPFGNDPFYDLGKCKLYKTYAEPVRKNTNACGIVGKNFSKMETKHGY